MRIIIGFESIHASSLLWPTEPSGRVRSFVQLRRIKRKRRTMMSPQNEMSPPDVCLPNVLNVKNFEATFYNGRRLDIQYDFNPEKIVAERLRLNLESLLPLFGGIAPPGKAEFTTIDEISNFVNIVNLDSCSSGIYASCSCHYNIPEKEQNLVYRCRDDHFHHYCASHVSAWFKLYLERAILLQDESKQFYYQLIADIHGPITAFEFTVGRYATAQYWLEYARTHVGRRRL
nr:repeat element protein-like protein F1.1 [Tranosema rostrale ichnovirus]